MFCLTHSGSSILGFGGMRNARSKRELIGCFIFRTQRWTVGLSLERWYIVVLWGSPIICRVSWRTCEWSVTDVRYQGMLSPRTPCRCERYRYDPQKLRPHWLTQWASSTITWFILFFILGSFHIRMKRGSTANSGDRITVRNCILLISWFLSIRYGHHMRIGQLLYLNQGWWLPY